MTVHLLQLRTKTIDVEISHSPNRANERRECSCAVSESVASSSDESLEKEYIHPRSTLVGALGKHSRVDEPLVFVTELVAFFNVEGKSRVTDPNKDKKRGEFFGFSRTAYGIVKPRTDGNRMFIYTDSGKTDMKEAHAYTLDENGSPSPSVLISV